MGKYTNADMFERIARHRGHEVVAVSYGAAYSDPANVAIECEECGEVILDVDASECEEVMR